MKINKFNVAIEERYEIAFSIFKPQISLNSHQISFYSELGRHLSERLFTSFKWHSGQALRRNQIKMQELPLLLNH